VIKYGAIIVLTAIVAVTYVVSAFRRTSDGPAVAVMHVVSSLKRTLDGPAKAGSSVPSEFDTLYETNCAGCHGADGKGDAARGLADPVFLRIADGATLRRVTASGVPGTAMPAFAKAAGGPFSDEQIDALVRDMRARWAGGGSAADLNPPPYSASTAGDPTRGGLTFGTFCSRCHGADGRGDTGGSSIVDASYLSLVSDQSLRTTVIAGRPDLGAPDWRGNVPGRPMSPDEVSDVVAWLAAKRP
jgi:mono/diheme cytochrome c family protein